MNLTHEQIKERANAAELEARVKWLCKQGLSVTAAYKPIKPTFRVRKFAR